MLKHGFSLLLGFLSAFTFYDYFIRGESGWGMIIENLIVSGIAISMILALKWRNDRRKIKAS